VAFALSSLFRERKKREKEKTQVTSATSHTPASFTR
jgi:hypothetical protein